MWPPENIHQQENSKVTNNKNNGGGRLLLISVTGLVIFLQAPGLRTKWRGHKKVLKWRELRLPEESTFRSLLRCSASSHLSVDLNIFVVLLPRSPLYLIDLQVTCVFVWLPIKSASTFQSNPEITKSWRDSKLFSETGSEWSFLVRPVVRRKVPSELDSPWVHLWAQLSQRWRCWAPITHTLPALNPNDEGIF